LYLSCNLQTDCTEVSTPNMDRLAAGGMRFFDALGK